MTQAMTHNTNLSWRTHSVVVRAALRLCNITGIASTRTNLHALALALLLTLMPLASQAQAVGGAASTPTAPAENAGLYQSDRVDLRLKVKNGEIVTNQWGQTFAVTAI
jgi:hypothetical protein